MKNYFDSTDVINLINDLKLDIKELWCYVKELAARTPVNIGNGIGIFKQLYRNKYEFKSIIPGNNITITDNGNDITISATGGGNQFTCEDVDNCLGISVSGDPNLVLNQQGNFISVGSTFDCSDLNNCSTDNLPEGVSNLYFTSPRAITALTGQNISIFNNDAGYITSNYISSISDTSTIDLTVSGSNLSADFIGNTSNVPEGSNLYFTEPRVRNTILTSLNTGLSGTISATDSVLIAFGKLQNQITNIDTSSPGADLYLFYNY